MSSPNIVSKSNGTEIIGLLYFILATQVTTPWLHYPLLFMGVGNFIESIIWSVYFKVNKEQPHD